MHIEGEEISEKEGTNWIKVRIKLYVSSAAQIQTHSSKLPKNSIPCELLGASGFRSGGTIQLLHHIWVP